MPLYNLLEYSDNYADPSDENGRKKLLKKDLGCEFIRINPDRKDFSINKKLNRIHRHIIESTRKLTEE